MIRPRLASVVLVSLALGAAGCNDQENTPAARKAEAALGIPADKDRSKSSKAARDLEVIDETKVVDPKTGEVLSDEKVVTPVKVNVEKREKTDVDVSVGKPQAAEK